MYENKFLVRCLEKMWLLTAEGVASSQCKKTGDVITRVSGLPKGGG